MKTKRKRIPRVSKLEELFKFQLLHTRNSLGCSPEYKFHPERKWRFDFAWPGYKVAVEIEGGIWNGGRHTTGKGFSDDCDKYNEAALAGWCVLRLTERRVKDWSGLELLKRALASASRAP